MYFSYFTQSGNAICTQGLTRIESKKKRRVEKRIKDQWDSTRQKMVLDVGVKFIKIVFIKGASKQKRFSQNGRKRK